MDLRASTALSVSPNGNDVNLGLPVPTRPCKRGRDRIGRVLVLPEAGLQAGTCRPPKIGKTRRRKNRRRFEIPDTRAHPEAAGGGARLLRCAEKRVAGERSGSVGQIFNAQHRIASQPSHGTRFWRRCRPHARAFKARAGASLGRQHLFVDAAAKSSLREFCPRSGRCARIACVDTRRKRGPRPNHPRQSQTR